MSDCNKAFFKEGELYELTQNTRGRSAGDLLKAERFDEDGDYWFVSVGGKRSGDSLYFSGNTTLADFMIPSAWDYTLVGFDETNTVVETVNLSNCTHKHMQTEAEALLNTTPNVCKVSVRRPTASLKRVSFIWE